MGEHIFRRARAIGEDTTMEEGGRIRLIASSNDAVSWGNWREILVHDSGSVDMGAARSLLVNHDPDQLAGGISGMQLDGRQLTSDAEIDDEARMRSGVSVRKAVKKRQLNGISIGYAYDQADTEWNADTRTLTVRKWRLLEISLTPIPADARAQVRSMPYEASSTTRTTNPTQSPAATPAAITKENRVSETPNSPNSQGSEAAKPHDEATRAKEMADLRTRAERAERENAIRSTAAEHGIDIKDMDLSKVPTEAEGIRMLLKRKADASATDKPKDGIVQVTRDAGDKLLARAKAGLYALAKITPTDADEKKEMEAAGGIRATSMKSLLRQCARSDGHSDAFDWSDMELGMWATRHINLASHGHRDMSAANKTTAGFSTILANVAHKAVMGGLNGYNAASWSQWCTVRDVPNFLSVTNAGLSSGRLTETAEDVAFPELTQKDGGYNSQLGLFGATVSLTYQTIVNDQLGFFMQELRRIGAIAALTVDRLAYNKLLNATWTNDNSTSAGLSTPSNVDKPRSALKNKLSPAGEKMGVVARYLLHDTANANAAQVAVGAIGGAGQTTSPSLGSRQVIPIESHWIGDTGLYSSTLTTDYFLVGDPNVVDTVLVNFLEGVGFSPMIMPFDPGAVAAEKYKIILPVQATCATHTDSAAAARVSGMQRAQA